MNCSEVVSRFSEYLDGTAAQAETEAIDRHLDECPHCVRYRSVLEYGARVLRDLPEPELREDFEPRLQHRLYNVDDERMLRVHAASGSPAMAVLGIALLLTAVAWSPTLFFGDPVVQLEPIVVDRAPQRTPFRPASSLPGTFSTKTDAGLDERLWDGMLLYDFTPLSQRYDQRTRARSVQRVDR